MRAPELVVALWVAGAVTLYASPAVGVPITLVALLVTLLAADDD